MVYNSAQQVTAPQVQQRQKPKNAEMFPTWYNTHELVLKMEEHTDRQEFYAQ